MATLEQLKKSIGKYYRIQPYLLDFSEAGVDRRFLDDAWQLTGVTEETFSLRHRELGLSTTLGKDSYVNFNKNRSATQRCRWRAYWSCAPSQRARAHAQRVGLLVSVGIN